MAIRDAKSMGSIADLLLNYVSTASVHDTNYEIALGMIQNYSRLYKKSCEEVAEICFVSKASVSRFCKFIGYTNYKEFQEALSFNYEMGSQYTKYFKTMLKTDKQQAMESYREPLEGVNKIAKTIENKGFSRKGKADGKNFVRWKPLHILERCKEKRQGKAAVRHGLGIVFKL